MTTNSVELATHSMHDDATSHTDITTTTITDNEIALAECRDTRDDVVAGDETSAVAVIVEDEQTTKRMTCGGMSLHPRRRDDATGTLVNGDGDGVRRLFSVSVAVASAWAGGASVGNHPPIPPNRYPHTNDDDHDTT